jgi:MFS family permease
MKLSPTLIKATVVGALGGLLFGFDTAVIAGTLPSLTTVYSLTPWTKGVTVFIALFGTVIGAMSAGVVGQRLGSRETLRILAVLYLVSALGCSLRGLLADLELAGRPYWGPCTSLKYLPHNGAEGWSVRSRSTS